MTKIRVGVIGAVGRMGATVCQAVLNDPSTSLELAVDENAVGDTVDNCEIEITETFDDSDWEELETQ